MSLSICYPQLCVVPKSKKSRLTFSQIDGQNNCFNCPVICWQAATSKVNNLIQLKSTHLLKCLTNAKRQIIIQVFFLTLSFFSFLGGERLSPFRTSAINWPIVPAPDGRWCVWSSQWNENWQEKPIYSEKTCPNATLSTTKPTWPDMAMDPGHRCWKPVTNRLSYGTAIFSLN
jgi:hypothetical protein